MVVAIKTIIGKLLIIQLRAREPGTIHWVILIFFPFNVFSFSALKLAKTPFSYFRGNENSFLYCLGSGRSGNC